MNPSVSDGDPGEIDAARPCADDAARNERWVEVARATNIGNAMRLAEAQPA